MKTLDATQAARARSSGLAPAFLCRLTTYTDRAAGTVDHVFSFARRALWYPWGGGSPVYYAPWLAALRELAASMVHVPGGLGSGVGGRTLSLVLANTEYRGQRLAALLDADTLEGATLEIDEFLLPEPAAGVIDLTGYAGTEHTVAYRGEVRRRIITNDAITIECETRNPRVRQARVTDTTASRRSVGVRTPLPYGDGVEVELAARRIGWTTAILTDIPDSAWIGEIAVADAGDGTTYGFPAHPFVARIGGETLLCSRVDAGTVAIHLRQYPSGAAARHPAHMAISQINGIRDNTGYTTEHGIPTWSDYTFFDVAPYPIESVEGLYLQNPLTGELAEVPAQYQLINYTREVGNGNGAGVWIDCDALHAMLDEFVAQSVVVDHDTGGTLISGDLPTGGTINANARDNNPATTYNWTQTAGDNKPTYTVTFAAPPATGDRSIFQIYIETIDPGSRVVVWKGTTISPAYKIAKIEGGTYNAWLSFNATGDYNTFTVMYFNYSLYAGSKVAKIRDIKRDVWYGGASPAVSQQAESAISSLSQEFRLFAKVKGIIVPIAYAAGYGFDDSTGWSAANCTRTRDTSVKVEGAASQKITIDFDALSTSVLPCESVSENPVAGGTGSWIGLNCTPTLDSGTKTQGTYSIKGVPSAADTNTALRYWCSSGKIADLRDTTTYPEGHFYSAVMFDIKMQHGTADGMVYVEIGSANNDDLRRYGIPMSDFPEDTWCTVMINPVRVGEIAGNDLDFDNWRYLEFLWNHGGTTRPTSAIVWIDNVRTVLCEHEIQNSTLASLDLSTEDDTYGIRVRTSGDFNGWFVDLLYEYDEVGVSVVLAESGSGTTVPTDHQRIYWNARQRRFPRDAWGHAPSTSVANGGAGIDRTNVNMIHVHITSKPCGVYPLDPVWDVWIDDLGCKNDASSPYVGTPGTAIEKPVDVVRHWIEEIAGEDLDETSLAAANTALGSNVLAGDARGWGPDWRSGLDQLALLCRANFVAEELAAGQRWKMLTASATYGFGSSVRTLTNFRADEVIDSGRDRGAELFSALSFYYGYRPSLGDSGDAFSGAVRVDADVNQSGGKVAAATVTAALANVGDLEGPDYFFRGVNDLATAQELAGYYYTEGARLARLIELEALSWAEGYDLELGDIVSLVLPWQAGTVKLRVIEVAKEFYRQRVRLRGVEVA